MRRAITLINGHDDYEICQSSVLHVAALPTWIRGLHEDQVRLGSVTVSASPLEAFASSGRLASCAGLVPVPRDSGRVTGNRRPKRFHRPLRQVFYITALSSIRAEGPSRVFYQRKRDENKLHTQALLALARRLVDVLRALLHDNRVYSLIPPSQVTATAAWHHH